MGFNGQGGTCGSKVMQAYDKTVKSHLSWMSVGCGRHIGLKKKKSIYKYIDFID